MGEPIPPESVHGSWLRSPEEDTASELVFRPPSYRFPPSRGRDAMRLSPDGTMIQATSGPTDLARHRMGRWRLENNILHLGVEGEEAQVLHLIHVSPEQLVAKR